MKNKENECPATIIPFRKKKTHDMTDKQMYMVTICYKDYLFCLLVWRYNFFGNLIYEKKNSPRFNET